MFSLKIFFFCKHRTAYDRRISDWSSDVCSSDLVCGLIAVSRRVVKPIHQLTEAMTGLAQGDVSVQISANGRKDEIAAMASAVEVFRGNAIERKRLEAKQEADLAEKEQRVKAMDKQIGRAHV